jgi:hypothetical protein
MKSSSLIDVFDWTEYKLRVIAFKAGFFDALAQKYPELSSLETKLCALILMECETGQCHTLLGMSSRAVRAMRLRLKDKFSLVEHETLHAYLVKLR